MNNQRKLIQAFSDVLKVDISALDESSSPDNVSEWDSLAVINIVCELERVFQVQFDILDIADFYNIGVIKGILEEKGILF